jgi:hypothetical protein
MQVSLGTTFADAVNPCAGSDEKVRGAEQIRAILRALPGVFGIVIASFRAIFLQLIK